MLGVFGWRFYRSYRLFWHAAESPDNQGRRRLRSSSKVNAGVSSPGIAEELHVRRSKRKSRQTVESSDDDGDGQPATRRHLDLQANDEVCLICQHSTFVAWATWYAVLRPDIRLGFSSHAAAADMLRPTGCYAQRHACTCRSLGEQPRYCLFARTDSIIKVTTSANS